MDDLHVSDMLAMQRQLWEKYRETWSPLEPIYARNSLLWMVGELGEVIDIVKKLGEDEIAADPGVRSHLVEELVDVAMYFHDILMRYGVSAEEFSAAYQKKHHHNMQRAYEKERRRNLDK